MFPAWIAGVEGQTRPLEYVNYVPFVTTYVSVKLEEAERNRGGCGPHVLADSAPGASRTEKPHGFRPWGGRWLSGPGKQERR